MDPCFLLLRRALEPQKRPAHAVIRQFCSFIFSGSFPSSVRRVSGRESNAKALRNPLARALLQDVWLIQTFFSRLHCPVGKEPLTPEMIENWPWGGLGKFGSHHVMPVIYRLPYSIPFSDLKCSHSSSGILGRC